MKEYDFEALRKRRERLPQRETDQGGRQEQSIGIWYPVTVDGVTYPVLSCFPAGPEGQRAGDKFRFLVSGGKRVQ